MSCGAAITWAITPAGKRIPLDPPAEAGTLIVDGEERDGTPRVRGATMFDLATARRTSHFASCPEADRWRRTR
jgi:hypothetical protein